MLMTPDAISKRVKRLQEELVAVQNVEAETCAYTVGVDEVNPPTPPAYNFEMTQRLIEYYTQQITALKHALNVFNTTMVLEGVEVDGSPLTIDAALVRMAMLTKQKAKLNKMRLFQKQSRADGGFRSKAEYRFRNFDAEEAEKHYQAVCSEIELIQQALNRINVVSEVDVPMDNQQ